MGKLLSLLFVTAALAMLALLFFAPHNTLLDDAGLVVSFVIFSTLAWGAALLTAIRRVTWAERRWRVIFWLLIFCWVPLLPPLLYALTGIGDLAARSRRSAAASVPTPREVAVVKGPRELAGAGDRTGA